MTLQGYGVRKRKQQASLDGVYDKIRRAKFHRDRLHELVDPLGESDAYQFIGEVQPDSRQHLYRWDSPSPFDPDIELILGDCIHNLRSALDHLAHELIVLNKQTPSGRSAFPIFDRPPGHRTCVLRRWKREPFNVRGVGAEANGLIEEVQPYNGMKVGRDLAVLRDLDNVDKHRHMLTSIPLIHAAGMAWSGEEPPFGEPEIRWFRKPPKHGEVAVRVTYPIPRDELDPHLHFTTFVSFDQRLGKQLAWRPITSILAGLVYAVEDEILYLRFAKLFPTK